MGIFSLFAGTNINEGIKQYEAAEDGVLLDVRTAGEYRSGHILGSINLSVDNIDKAAKVLPDKSKEIFVYCLSGARSSQAVNFLKRSGYEKVNNIGGLNRYKGKLEK